MTLSGYLQFIGILLLAACTRHEGLQDDDSLLPQGEYPLQLAVRLDAMHTRSDGGMDAWMGNGTEHIAVRLGSSGQRIGKYVIQSTDGAAQPAVGTDPLYWSDTQTATVEAWYPYTEGEVTFQLADQSAGYATFDLLYGSTSGSYTQPVNLTFYHQLARVKYTLMAGEGISEEQLQNATVTLLAQNAVKAEGGKMIAALTQGDGTVKPRVSGLSGDALLPPQDRTGEKFICVTLNQTSFYYTPASGEATLQTGECHDYTITVRHDGMTVQVKEEVGWQPGADEEVVLQDNCIIYDGTETAPKIGDYYYTDGTWSDGGLRKLYPGNGQMEFLATKPAQIDGKTVIGTIFALGHSPYDHSDYTRTGIGQATCNGYVVARADAATSSDYYGNALQNVPLYPTDEDGNAQDNVSAPQTDWSGYAYTQKYVEAANGDLSDKNNDYRAVKHAVVTYLQNHPTHTAPQKSTGWFLPSIGQLRQIFLVQQQGGYHSKLQLETGVPYFSSSLHFSQFKPLGMTYVTSLKTVENSTQGYVRPILAF